MTSLILAALAFIFAYAIYIAVLVGRRTPAGAFLDAGATLPPWALMFAGAGIVLGGLGLNDHFRLTAIYGLSYSHVGLGLTLVALCGAMAHKRLWLAARLTGLTSPVEIIGTYYGSVTIRIVLIGVGLVLAGPFAAQSLDSAGRLVASATDGLISREQGIFVFAVFLFIFAALGGWRAVVMVVAAQSFLLIALLAFVAVMMAAGFEPLAVFANGPSGMKGVMADAIPGVMQYTAGLGKEAPAGGPWTALAIFSTSASLIGLALNPGMGLAVATTRLHSALAFQQVWMIAGLAAGLLVLVSPIIGAEIAAADPAGLIAGSPDETRLIGRLAALDPFVGVSFIVLLLASLEIVVAFFVAAAATLITVDVVHRYALPDLRDDGRRLAARIVMAVLFATVAGLAIFAPIGSAIGGSVALSFAAQLLPAAIGLGFAPWISRSAVITGLIFGMLLVVFTEPLGLVAFEGVFIPLPWGRWPLTIHSAAWGLFFNIAACLLVSLFTRTGPEREVRDRLHVALREELLTRNGGSRIQTAKWSLSLIWTYLALGPGAVLGNTFFSKPVFVEGEASLGVPSLWVWQIMFWLIGVLLIWWLAYRCRMSIVDPLARPRRVELSSQPDRLLRRRAPHWIALLIGRLAER